MADPPEWNPYNGMGKENPILYKQSNFFWEMTLAYGRVSVMWKIHVAQP